jgi:hypothetical protein
MPAADAGGGAFAALSQRHTEPRASAASIFQGAAGDEAGAAAAPAPYRSDAHASGAFEICE